MEQTKHCVLCKNSLSRFKDGLYCGITNEKPDFNNSCSEIKLGNNFFNELKSVHIEFEKIKRTKITNYLHFFTFLLISLIIFIFSVKLKIWELFYLLEYLLLFLQ